MKRTGFTLTELLVVLGILALMAAILFPVFSQVREKGRQTVCISNERQLGAAFLMYAHDDDGYLLPSYRGWAATLYPDTKSVLVFRCPTDATASDPPFYPVSYGINLNLWHTVAGSVGGLRLVPHTISEVSASTVLLFEVVHATAELTIPYEGTLNHDNLPKTIASAGDGGLLSLPTTINGREFDVNADVRYATGVMSGADRFTSDTSLLYEGAGRHHGGANFLYSDGHVKWLRPEQVSTGADALSPADAPTSFPGPGIPWVVRAAGSEKGQFAATFSTK